MNSISNIEVRISKLKELAFLLESNKANLAKSITLDNGQPIKISLEELEITVKYLESLDIEDMNIKQIINTYPIGKFLIFLPYDAPTIMFTLFACNCYLAGNSCIVRFSSQTKKTSEIINNIIYEIGIQDTIEITNKSSKQLGQESIKTNEINGLIICGSSEIGNYYKQFYKYFDKIIFNGPGGYPMAFVISNADPSFAGNIISKDAFLNSGQYCATYKQVWVHPKLFNEFINSLINKTKELNIGSPFDLTTDIGQIVNKTTASLFMNFINEVKNRKLDILLGGIFKNNVAYPTIVKGEVDFSKEYFGPLLFVSDNFDDDVIRISTNSIFGLYSGVFGKGNLALKIKNELLNYFAIVSLNSSVREHNPLSGKNGGKKGSGWVYTSSKISPNNLSGFKDGPVSYPKELTYS